MPAIPPNTTTRYFVDYQQGQFSHTAVFRTAPLVTEQEVSLAIDAFFTALGPLLVSTTITAVRVQQALTNFSTPLPLSIVGNAYGGGPTSNIVNATFITFIGRSTGGRQAKLTVFGSNATVPQDFRELATENAAVADTLQVLQDFPNVNIGIDGNPVVWYPYANRGYNAYWQRQSRS